MKPTLLEVETINREYWAYIRNISVGRREKLKKSTLALTEGVGEKERVRIIRGVIRARNVAWRRGVQSQSPNEYSKFTLEQDMLNALL